jgi:hypothetical protein
MPSYLSHSRDAANEKGAGEESIAAGSRGGGLPRLPGRTASDLGIGIAIGIGFFSLDLGGAATYPEPSYGMLLSSGGGE